MPILEVLRHENPDRLRMRGDAISAASCSAREAPCPCVYAGRPGRSRGGGRAAHEPVYRRAHHVPVICTDIVTHLLPDMTARSRRPDYGADACCRSTCRQAASIVPERRFAEANRRHGLAPRLMEYFEIADGVK